MIKLIASDLDGTLLFDYAASVPQSTLDLIQKLTDKGIHFVVASGRQYANEKRLFSSITNPLSYIAENGSVAIHNDQLFSMTQLDDDLAKRILKKVKEDGLFEPLVSCPDACYIENSNKEYANYITNLLKNETIVVDDVLSIDQPIVKIAICKMGSTPDDMQDYLTRMMEEFGQEIKIVTSGNIWLDFITPGANKGSSLKKLMDHLEITPDECIAFGDQYNDVEMLQTVGHGYAMKTCAKGVERYAAHQTDCVDDVLRNVLEELN